MSNTPSSYPVDARPDYLTVKEAAAYLRLRPVTLNMYRLHGHGPLYSQAVPRGSVIYRRCDLDDWVASRLRRNSSEAYRVEPVKRTKVKQAA